MEAALLTLRAEISRVELELEQNVSKMSEIFQGTDVQVQGKPFHESYPFLPVWNNNCRRIDTLQELAELEIHNENITALQADFQSALSQGLYIRASCGHVLLLTSKLWAVAFADGESKLEALSVQFHRRISDLSRVYQSNALVLAEIKEKCKTWVIQSNELKVDAEHLRTNFQQEFLELRTKIEGL
jgi:hypothetical protein